MPNEQRFDYSQSARSLLRKLSALFADICLLITIQARSEEEILLLLKLLRRFKAGTLMQQNEAPLPPIPLPEVADPVSEMGRRRKEFIAHLRQVGKDLAFRELLDELPSAARSIIACRFDVGSFAHLLVGLRVESQKKYFDNTTKKPLSFIKTYRGWGNTAIDKLARGLIRRGLEPSMTDEEISHIFSLTPKETKDLQRFQFRS